MSSRAGSADERTVWSLIETINLSWVNARWETLHELFDEHCVFVLPGFARRLNGRRAAIESYKDFVDRAVVHEFKELEPTVDVNENVAVATYRFEITWDTDSTRYIANGHDLFVFRRANGNWRAVWRTQIPGEEKVL